MEYFVADSYKNCQWIGEPYPNEKGKMYVKIKQKCDRCGGTGLIASRVENDNIIPISVDGGICYKCHGAKMILNEVRAYDEIEYVRYKRRQKSQQNAREKSMEENFSKNKMAWLEREGFNEEGKTFVYFLDNSFDVKEDLKAAGFKFNMLLKWHTPNPISDYKDAVIEVDVNDVVEFAAWGEGFYKETAKDYVNNLINSNRPSSPSEYIGEVGDRLKNLSVRLVRKTGFEGRYGYTNIYTFAYGDNMMVWMTSKFITSEVGSELTLSGTIKEHSEFQGVKQTKLSRCKIKES